MNKELRSALTSIVFLFCIYLLSFLGSNVVSTIQSINSFTFLLLLSVIIQVIFFIPSFILKTEKLYDLIGSTTYVIVALIAYLSVDNKTSTDTILFLFQGLILKNIYEQEAYYQSSSNIELDCH